MGKPDNKRTICHDKKFGFYTEIDEIKNFKQGKMFWQCEENEDGWTGKCCAYLSHDHTIITTRLRNNHPWEPLTWRLAGRRHIEVGKRSREQNGLVLTYVWWLRIRRDISAAEFPLRSEGSYSHTRLPQPGPPVLEESPQHVAVKVGRILFRWDRDCYRLKGVLLKGPCMYLLPDELTCSKLQYWCNSLKRAKDIWGGTELFGVRARNEGPALFQAEVLAHATVPLLQLFQQAGSGACHIFPPSVWLTLLSPVVIPWDCYNQLSHKPKTFSVAVLHNLLTSSHSEFC